MLYFVDKKSYIHTSTLLILILIVLILILLLLSIYKYLLAMRFALSTVYTTYHTLLNIDYPIDAHHGITAPVFFCYSYTTERRSRCLFRHGSAEG